MNKSVIAILLASSMSLGACATRNNDSTLASAGTGAAIGAVGGAAVGAVTGIGVLEGAAVGAVVGGLAGAVWSDNNNDGYADGYVQNGQYYEGRPSGWDSTLGRVATGAAGGAVLGGVAGALIPGLSIVEGALAGAVIGGIAGAVWADNDKDGHVDGYVQNGTYYPGTPSGYNANMPASSTGSGERG